MIKTNGTTSRSHHFGRTTNAHMSSATATTANPTTHQMLMSGTFSAVRSMICHRFNSAGAGGTSATANPRSLTSAIIPRLRPIDVADAPG